MQSWRWFKAGGTRSQSKQSQTSARGCDLVPGVRVFSQTGAVILHLHKPENGRVTKRLQKGALTREGQYKRSVSQMWLICQGNKNSSKRTASIWQHSQVKEQVPQGTTRNLTHVPSPPTRKGPCSVSSPSSELHPGPPLSHSTTGSDAGEFWDSVNLPGGSWRLSVGTQRHVCHALAARVRSPVVQMLPVRHVQVSWEVPEAGLLGKPWKVDNFVVGRYRRRCTRQQEVQQRRRRHLTGSYTIRKHPHVCGQSMRLIDCNVATINWSINN